MKASSDTPGRSLLPRGRKAWGWAAGLALGCSLWADPIQISPAAASFSSRLPVMVIDTAGSGPLVKDGLDRPAELNLFEPAAGATGWAGRLPALASALTISVRGTSSAEFPKKSFNLTLRNRQGAKFAQPLLDLPAAEKWALVAPWKYDPTYVNNAFVYALSNRLGRWAPRTRNQGWQTGAGATQLPGLARAVGAFPLAAGSADAALAGEFTLGAQALQASAVGGVAGVGLMEMYELDANGRLANLSIRAMIGAGDGPLTSGMVIQGPACKRLLIRAVGPSLAQLGMTDVLPDPLLTVYAGADPIASNDNGAAAADARAIASAASRVGAFPLAAGAGDAALLITLPPGTCTLEVKSRAGAGGAVLLEIYEVP